MTPKRRRTFEQHPPNIKLIMTTQLIYLGTVMCIIAAATPIAPANDQGFLSSLTSAFSTLISFVPGGVHVPFCCVGTWRRRDPSGSVLLGILECECAIKVIWRGVDSVRDTRQPLSKGRRVEWEATIIMVTPGTNLHRTSTCSDVGECSECRGLIFRASRGGFPPASKT